MRSRRELNGSERRRQAGRARHSVHRHGELGPGAASLAAARPSAGHRRSKKNVRALSWEKNR